MTKCFCMDDIKNSISHFFELISCGKSEDLHPYLCQSGYINYKNDDGQTPVLIAIVSRQIESLSLLILNGVNLNTPNRIGQTPLHVSILIDFPKAQELLLYSDCNINTTDKAGRSALHYCTMSGNIQLFKSLLNAKADPNIKDKRGRTVLMTAANAFLNSDGRLKKFLDLDDKDQIFATTYQYYQTMTQVLIESGHDLNSTDIEGKNALKYSIYYRNHELTLVLLEKGISKPDEEDIEALTDLQWEDCLFFINENGAGFFTLDDYLHDENHEIDFDHDDFLEKIEGEQLEEIKKIISGDLDDNFGSSHTVVKGMFESFQETAEKIYGTKEVIDEKLKIKGNKEAIDKNVKTLKGTKEDVGEETILIKGKKPKEEKSNSPGDDFNYLNKIDKEQKKKVYSKNKLGQGPLMIAAAKGNLQQVKSLIKEGAQVNARDFSGKNALIYAVLNGQVDIVKRLLEAENIDLDVKDEKGANAFLYAVTKGRYDILELFLQTNMFRYVRIKGKTALMIAAEKGFEDIVNLLIASGVNPGERDYKGQTAADYAQEKGFKGLSTTIRKKIF